MGGCIMRCPKCGYISFDHLDSCRKCKKKISGAVADLKGVVFEAVAPVFLALEPKEPDLETEEGEVHQFDEESVEAEEEGVELSLGEDEIEDDAEIVMDLGDDEGLDLDLGVEEEKIDGEGLDLDFDELEGATPEGEITLDFDEKEQEQVDSKDESLPLDFGEIDISDLAPPDEGGGEEVLAETLSLDEEPVPEIALAEGPSDTAFPAPSGSGLEDLQVEDLDLGAASPLVAGSKAGDKLMPSVKTGTALDDFEIDLGDLSSDEK